MHIAEGFLPPVHAVAWTVVATPFVVHGAREVVRTVRSRPETGVLLAASGAFTFVLSALKLPSVTGSCSHPTGTGLGTVSFKPPVMAFIGTVVLLFQALLLAHGGLTTLGANVFSMAIVGPWVGYGGFLLARRLGSGPLVAVFVAAFLADLSTYVTTSAELDQLSFLAGWRRGVAAGVTREDTGADAGDGTVGGSGDAARPAAGTAREGVTA